MRFVVPSFIDEIYPDEVVLLALHLQDAGAIAWNSSRWGSYGPPGGGYIPQVVVGAKSDTYVGYPGVPPNPWISRVEVQIGTPTDIVMSLDSAHVIASEWLFTARVCMEPTGTARTVRVNVGYTIDNFPLNAAYPYRATLRAVGAHEDVALNPDECVDVQRSFVLTQTDLDNWETITVVAWAQTPQPGFGEVYQATKDNLYRVHADGFESGDTSGWSAVY